jgi:hypothetical protein
MRLHRVNNVIDFFVEIKNSGEPLKFHFMVEVIITDPLKLKATINSLRPAQKGDEVPKEVLCYVHNEAPVLETVSGMHPKLSVRPVLGAPSLQTELTRPFTGLLLLAVSSERTRLSIAMFPAEVKHLAVGETHKFAFFSHSLIKFLAAVKSSRVTLRLEAEMFKVIVAVDLDAGEGLRTIQGNCPYVADGDTEDGRSIFEGIPLEKGVRITGEEMLQSLKLIDPQLVTLAMHTHKQGGVQRQVFTMSCSTQASGEMQFVIMYTFKGADQEVFDVRDVGRIKETLQQAPAEGIDENLEQLKAACDEEAEHKEVDMDFGETLMQSAREYLKLIVKPADGPKKVRFDSRLGAFEINKGYNLHAHGLVQSKQLIALLADHVKDMEQALTVLMGHRDTTSYIVLAIPLANNGLILHAVACSLAEDDS